MYLYNKLLQYTFTVPVLSSEKLCSHWINSGNLSVMSSMVLKGCLL